jgi:sec-independent protein translocase protein TatB
MNLLGMGPMELLLIVVLALIVFGPARLPEIMGQVGKAIGDFRRATSDLSDEFNRTIQAELQETRAMVDEAKSTLTEARESLTEVHTSVNAAVTGAPAPFRTTAPPPEALPASNGVNGETHTDAPTNGSVPAAVSPPLAEAAKWSWETSAPPAPSTSDEIGTPEPVTEAAASESSDASATPAEATNATNATADASGVKTDASEVKPDASDLKPDASDLKTDASDLKTDASDLKTDASEVKTTTTSADAPQQPGVSRPASSPAAGQERAARDELLPPY